MDSTSLPAPERSLFLHAMLRRTPHAVLRKLLAALPPDQPESGPQGPVAVLERRIAGLLGKESALFFPSGTMAQQAALRVHAERSGRPVFAAHPMTHLAHWEQRGYAVVHGLRMQSLGDANEPFGVADIEAVAEPPAAVLWELPQRDLGGLLPTWEALGEQVAAARALGAATHLDGARLWEAQTGYQRPFAEIAAPFDTVYVSLYKALRGARGAVLAGEAEVIRQVEVWRTRLGGAIRDAWPLAALALVGLDELLPRMPEFREHAIALAAAINADGVAHTVPRVPLTPLFHVHLPAARAAVERAGHELLRDKRVQLYGRVRSSTDPERCSFEITVGENGLEFTPAEVAALVRELVERAG